MQDRSLNGESQTNGKLIDGNVNGMNSEMRISSGLLDEALRLALFRVLSERVPEVRYASVSSGTEEVTTNGSNQRRTQSLSWLHLTISSVRLLVILMPMIAPLARKLIDFMKDHRD